MTLTDITCRKCGTPNREAAKFCRSCGNSSFSQSVKCLKCSTVNREAAKFCAACGNKIADMQETASTLPALTPAKPPKGKVAPVLQQEPPSILDEIRRELNIPPPYVPKKKKARR